MITIQNRLTKNEIERTRKLLFQVKTECNHNEYYLFKKLILIVGLIHGVLGFISYQEFLYNSERLMNKPKPKPTRVFGFDQRNIFFGINIKFIKEATIDQIRIYVYDAYLKTFFENQKF